ncbi:MAG: DUF2785 domain-containing protein [Planctomycetes bacterium]|nr:DUF2785 domain-containing protein [Planctomycetota bacterium]
MRTAVLCALLPACLLAQEPTPRDWQPLLTASAKPAATELPGLLRELTSLLGSPDPKLRDDVAYTLLARWIVRDGIVADEQLRELAVTCRENLRAGIGERDTTTVLRRSFSALTLSLLLARDNQQPWLDADGFAALLADALRYLHDERDVRGFDARIGWLHSVAHTADVLKFAARSERLTKPQQAQLLQAIADKLAAVDVPLCAGEDERLARALLALCARDDLDTAALSTWLTQLCATRYAGTDAEQLARRENRKHVLVSLFTLLTLDRRESTSLTAARAALRHVLGD